MNNDVKEDPDLIAFEVLRSHLEQAIKDPLMTPRVVMLTVNSYSLIKSVFNLKRHKHDKII